MARDRTDTEVWETTTESKVAINTYDARGNVRTKLLGGRVGVRVTLTATEREEINEDLAATAQLCIFRNGFLRPIRGVPPEVIERFETETKPAGGLSSEELIALFGKTGNAFVTAVAKLNEPTLRRLATLAPEADASASQSAAIDRSMERFLISGMEGLAAKRTQADELVHAGPRTT